MKVDITFKGKNRINQEFKWNETSIWTDDFMDWTDEQRIKAIKDSFKGNVNMEPVAFSYLAEYRTVEIKQNDQ